MELPSSLVTRLYLLTYNPASQRLVTGSELGYLLRAAALADLMLAGCLADTNGKVTARTQSPDDPLLAVLLAEIAASTKPRSWRHWIRRGDRSIRRSVREHLEAAKVVIVRPRRVLGLFPATEVAPRQPRIVEDLLGTVRAALRPSQPASRVDIRDAFTVALAAAAELKPVFTRRQLREHRDRIGRLTECAGPIPHALRKVIRQTRSAVAAG